LSNCFVISSNFPSAITSPTEITPPNLSTTFSIFFSVSTKIPFETFEIILKEILDFSKKDFTSSTDNSTFLPRIKICFSDNQDSEIVEFLATDFGDPNLRQYELFPTFSDTNVSVDARKPLRGVYSNSEEIQLNIWRTGYTIRYNNSK